MRVSQIIGNGIKFMWHPSYGLLATESPISDTDASEAIRSPDWQSHFSLIEDEEGDSEIPWDDKWLAGCIFNNEVDINKAGSLTTLGNPEDIKRCVQDLKEQGYINDDATINNKPYVELRIWNRMGSNLPTLQSLVQSDPAASAAFQTLTQAGGTVYVVGGAVRDTVMGNTPKDIDLMVSGLQPDEISNALSSVGKVDYTGKAFGVFRFKTGGSEVEIALPRTEISTGPGHTDFDVQPNPYLRVDDDLKRRDFTVNAMAYDVGSDSLIDPYGGQDDINNKRLRLVNPSAFNDDPLRIVRALVSNARFGLEPDTDTVQAMKENADSIRHLPGERIQMELTKLLTSADPATSFELAEETGLIDYIAPELSATIGFDQNNPYHDLNVFDHTVQVLRAITPLTNDPDLRLAALFHDSGKPDSYSENDDPLKQWTDSEGNTRNRGNFYRRQLEDGSFVGQDHEDVSATLVEEFMRRLKYPTARIERVKTLAQHHMFDYFTTEKQTRKFLNSLGGDAKMAFDLLTLRQADATGKSDGSLNPSDASAISTCKSLLQSVLEKEQAFSKKDLAVNGNDLIKAGIKPGPDLGKILDNMLEIVIDNPDLNTKDQLMALLQEGRLAADSNYESYIDALMKRLKSDTQDAPLVSYDQPKWKWSYDGNELTIWPVDPKYGQPHHYEVTGKDFYKFAQGRVYVDHTYPTVYPKGMIEILVWEDRGNPHLRQQSIVEVNNWLEKNVGRPADVVANADEGIQWTELGRSPTNSELERHYWNDQDDDVTVVEENQEELEEFEMWYSQSWTPEQLREYGVPYEWSNRYENWLKSIGALRIGEEGWEYYNWNAR